MSKIETSPVEKIKQDLTRDLEILNLEELFSHNLKCESKHEHPSMPACSIEAFATTTSLCDPALTLICENLATVDLKWMRQGYRCIVCGKRAAECWKIVPL